MANSKIRNNHFKTIDLFVGVLTGHQRLNKHMTKIAFAKYLIVDHVRVIKKHGIMCYANVCR